MVRGMSLKDALRLVHRSDPKWNDRGTRIGYRRFEGGTWEFGSIEVPPIEQTDVSLEAGDNSTEVVTDIGGVTEFAWRPNSSNEVTVVAGDDLYMVNADSGSMSPLSVENGPHKSIRWDSDGSRFAYFNRDRLWIHDTETGGDAPLHYDRPIADQFHRISVEWAPGDELIATLCVTPAGNLGIVVFDVASGAAVWSYHPESGQVPAFEWVDEDHLVYAEDDPVGSERVYRSADVGENEKGVPILSETSDRVLARVEDDPVSNGDGLLAVLSGRTGYHHIYLVDVETRREYAESASPGFEGDGVTQLTRGDFEARADSADVPAWSESGDQLAYITNEVDPGERHLNVVDVSEGGSDRVADFDRIEGNVANPIWSGDDLVAVERAGRHTPPDIHVASAETGAVRRVTRGHPSFSVFEDLPEPEPVAIESPDGLEIYGYLYVPNQENPPTVVMCHGGPHNQMRHGFHYKQAYSSYHAYDLCLVEHGYAVLELNYRGSVGYGREFEGAHHMSVGKSNLGDCIATAEYVRSRDDLGDRVGLWGRSYGGYLANHLAARTDAFDCTVNFAGIWDWGQWILDAREEQWFAGRRRFAQRLGGDPDSADPEVRERYRIASPCEYAADLDTPLFALHGREDVNVLFNQMDMLVEDLVKADKVFEMAYYPHEAHVFQQPSTLRDVFRRVIPFFDENLDE